MVLSVDNVRTAYRKKKKEKCIKLSNLTLASLASFKA